MKQKLIKRAGMGLLEGIAIGFLISLLVSMCIGDGNFYSVQPHLIDKMGNELNAVIFQTVLCALLGTGFGMASVIWEIESWSLAKQSGVYFLIACVIMLPVSYVADWMHHSVVGVLIYFGIFALIFALIWVARYLFWKNKIKKMNDTVKKVNHIN